MLLGFFSLSFSFKSLMRCCIFSVQEGQWYWIIFPLPAGFFFFFEVCTEMLNYRGASCCLERLQWPLGTADELSSLEPKFSRLLSCQLHSFASVLKNLPQQLGNDKDFLHCSVILHHIIMRKNFQIICMIGEASLLNFLWISLLLHRNSNTSVMSYLNERWEKIMQSLFCRWSGPAFSGPKIVQGVAVIFI